MPNSSWVLWAIGTVDLRYYGPLVLWASGSSVPEDHQVQRTRGPPGPQYQRTTRSTISDDHQVHSTRGPPGPKHQRTTRTKAPEDHQVHRTRVPSGPEDHQVHRTRVLVHSIHVYPVLHREIAYISLNYLHFCVLNIIPPNCYTILQWQLGGGGHHPSVATGL